MKRRKSSGVYRKEKMIMIASTVLVLAAMTVTGAYIYNSNQPEEPENNVVDFSALEKDTQDKGGQVAQVENKAAKNLTSDQEDSGELDYDPFYEEADRQLNMAKADEKTPEDGGEQESVSGPEESSAVTSIGYAEIGKTARQGEAADAQAAADQAAGQEQDDQAAAEGQAQDNPEGEVADVAEDAAANAPEEGQAMEAVADVTKEAVNLHFSEDAKLEWPIAGNVLLNYSMDKTVYFATLQQYKYNPSVVIGATQGANVACAADGIVESIYKDPQTGNTILMSLGDGYELTYGQLQDVMVEEGDFVETGAFIGKVAAPTKYYTAEGTNVYFKLTKDGEPVNPLNYLG